MKEAYITAAAIESNGHHDTNEYHKVEVELSNLGINPSKLVIDPLRVPWDSPIEDNHFRSGCAPIQAIAKAKAMIENCAARAVIIEGKEPLKTGYERDERHKLMAIYGDQYSLPEAYTDVAKVFMAKHGMTDSEFKKIAQLLFENYERTFYQTNTEKHLDKKWFEPITELFRGVDCANPLIDFSGKLLICEGSVAKQIALPDVSLVEVAGVGLGFTEDGREHILHIAEYDHLEKAYLTACRQAGIDFSTKYLAGQALLETYTCYPVVPIAFLLASGIASSIESIPAILKEHEVTVTGGMNLARAPWNNPVLNALITMYYLLRKGPLRVGAVHGNGGMGFSQGVAILKKV
ncbi:MAG: hypothetical protein HQ553_18140 [Chloroflexi bacterium]|nr:hypothetical protein [Chloroflexota bacterium]